MLEFKCEKINNHVYRIFGFCTELMYLVVGEEKAALLDTGSGFGSLKNCVREITDKPLIVLVTHGHVDHAMGALEFDDVYMNLIDEYIYEEHKEKTFRLDGLSISEIQDVFTMDDYVESAPFSHFKDLQEGDSFDLGGIHLDVFAIQGHTKGSLAFLIREDKLLLTGDGCNTFTFMFEDYSTSIETYYKNLKDLKEKVDGKYENVLWSHGDGVGYKNLLEDVITVCEDILSNKTENIPFEFKGHYGLIAKKDDSHRKGNIVFNKNHIFD